LHTFVFISACITVLWIVFSLFFIATVFKPFLSSHPIRSSLRELHIPFPSFVPDPTFGHIPAPPPPPQQNFFCFISLPPSPSLLVFLGPVHTILPTTKHVFSPAAVSFSYSLHYSSDPPVLCSFSLATIPACFRFCPAILLPLFVIYILHEPLFFPPVPDPLMRPPPPVSPFFRLSVTMNTHIPLLVAHQPLSVLATPPFPFNSISLDPFFSSSHLHLPVFSGKTTTVLFRTSQGILHSAVSSVPSAFVTEPPQQPYSGVTISTLLEGNFLPSPFDPSTHLFVQ